MTQLEEGDIRHVSGLPNSASAMVGVEAGFNNLAYSSSESTTECSKVLLVDVMCMSWLMTIITYHSL